MNIPELVELDSLTCDKFQSLPHQVTPLPTEHFHVLVGHYTSNEAISDDEYSGSDYEYYENYEYYETSDEYASDDYELEHHVCQCANCNQT